MFTPIRAREMSVIRLIVTPTALLKGDQSEDFSRTLAKSPNPM